MAFGNEILTFENASADLSTYLQMAENYVHDLQAFSPDLRWSREAWLNDLSGTFLIRSRTDVIGLVVLEIVNFFEQPEALYFSEFYLRPEFRRQGYGREAVSAILDQWDRDLFLYVLKGNQTAAQFWNTMAKENHWKKIERPEIRQERDCELRIYRQPGRE